MATVYAWNINDRSQPPVDWVPIDPSDSADVSTPAENGDTIIGVRTLRANSAGNIAVIMASGHSRVLPFLAGEQRDGLFRRVLETGTTVEVDTDGVGIEGGV